MSSAQSSAEWTGYLSTQAQCAARLQSGECPGSPSEAIALFAGKYLREAEVAAVAAALTLSATESGAEWALRIIEDPTADAVRRVFAMSVVERLRLDVKPAVHQVCSASSMGYEMMRLLSERLRQSEGLRGWAMRGDLASSVAANLSSYLGTGLIPCANEVVFPGQLRHVFSDGLERKLVPDELEQLRAFVEDGSEVDWGRARLLGSIVVAHQTNDTEAYLALLRERDMAFYIQALHFARYFDGDAKVMVQLLEEAVAWEENPPVVVDEGTANYIRFSILIGLGHHLDPSVIHYMSELLTRETKYMHRSFRQPILSILYHYVSQAGSEEAYQALDRYFQLEMASIMDIEEYFWRLRAAP